MDPAERRELVENYLRKPYKRVITRDADGTFLGSIPDFPECESSGHTSEVAAQRLEAQAYVWLMRRISIGCVPEVGASEQTKAATSLNVEAPKTYHAVCCKHCQFWDIGTCRRYPPVLTPMFAASSSFQPSFGPSYATSTAGGQQPLTQSGNWCGEFKLATRHVKAEAKETETQTKSTGAGGGGTTWVRLERDEKFFSWTISSDCASVNIEVQGDSRHEIKIGELTIVLAVK